jgi:hypothetical protein
LKGSCDLQENLAIVVLPQQLFGVWFAERGVFTSRPTRLKLRKSYGVDTDAVALKVKQEFGAKEKARKAANPEAKGAPKSKQVA